MAEDIRLTCATCGKGNRLARARLTERPKCGNCGDLLSDGSVPELDPKTLERAVQSDDLPLLVDFWAPWCGPCRVMAPEFAKAAKTLAPTVRLARLNTQDHPDAANRAHIQGIPALVLYHRGREIARLAGACPAADITAFVTAKLPAKA
jgi:thioredoxin 2